MSMTPQPPIDPTLRDEAFDLVIRIQNDPTNAAALETARRWRARSPAHRLAWDRAAALHELSGAAFRAEAAPSPARVSRRAVLAGGTAALAAGLGGAVVLPGALTRLGADVTTSTAEIRDLVLPDDSRVTLGPDSAARLAFDDGSRRVDLLAGMAFFEPAAGRAQPFEARAGEVSASTFYGAFDLSQDAGAVTFASARGALKVMGRGTPPVALADGEWLTIDEEGAVERGRREAGGAAAWRSGLIIAKRETVGAVAARIARWLPGRVLVDPAIGGRRVSGVYNLAAPLSALQAVAQPHGGHVRQATPWLTVISRV